MTNTLVRGVPVQAYLDTKDWGYFTGHPTTERTGSVGPVPEVE